jgi:hypothetical protein
MKPLAIILAITALVAVSILFARGKSANAEMPFAQLLEFLPKEAVSIAKEHHGVTLDYSPASVEQVEAILGKLHDEYKRRGTTEGQRGLALAFGVYIGEVIRKQTGEGFWKQDHPVAGEGSMPLHWKGHDSFPVAWCLKRLANGEADNVWHKYQMIVGKELSARPSQ